MTSPVATNRSALLVLRDGTGSPKNVTISPMEGDVEYTPGEVSFVEVLDRGRPIANGEGVIEESSGLAEISFSFYVKELTDVATVPDAILRWMEDIADTSAASVVTASWTSTTTRTDGRATLDALYYPHGTGSGKALYVLDDCLLISKNLVEGSPSLFNVVLRSTTARKWQLTAAT